VCDCRSESTSEHLIIPLEFSDVPFWSRPFDAGTVRHFRLRPGPDGLARMLDVVKRVGAGEIVASSLAAVTSSVG
jgi:hypothetical protein